MTNLCPVCQLPLDPYDQCLICAAMGRVREARADLIRHRHKQRQNFVSKRTWQHANTNAARKPHND